MREEANFNVFKRHSLFNSGWVPGRDTSKKDVVVLGAVDKTEDVFGDFEKSLYRVCNWVCISRPTLNCAIRRGRGRGGDGEVYTGSKNRSCVCVLLPVSMGFPEVDTILSAMHYTLKKYYTLPYISKSPILCTVSVCAHCYPIGKSQGK